MTDKEKFVEFFKQYNIDLQTAKHPYPGEDTLFIAAKQSPNVEGYGGFAAEFAFDPEGRFLKMGIWE